jgi:D-glycero-alpha-D-manno-heptose-7-phosphate kinase
MIVTKTPLRISFFGGGSDIPQYYNNNEGMVISASIDKYINIAVSNCINPHIRIVYSEVEEQYKVEDIKHDRVRELLKYYNIHSNIEICSFSGISTKGTGLGSSSTFTVGLANAFSLYSNNRELNKKELAELACYIEIDKCNEPIGKQDQYAASCGGFNIMKFKGDEVECRSFSAYGGSVMAPVYLNEKLQCFATKISRKTSDILNNQVDSLKKGSIIDTTSEMVSIAKVAFDKLMKLNIDDFGSLLNDTWNLKKKLASNISNPCIDEIYELGMKNGALGGKLLGAGGGGYMLFYTPEKYQSKVAEAMEKAVYPEFKFNFEYDGTKAIKI